MTAFTGSLIKQLYILTLNHPKPFSMKKIIFTISLVLVALISHSQGCFWHENFDAPSLGDSVTSSSSAGNPGWSICSRVSTSPNNCDSAFVDLNDTVYLRTSVIDFTGLTFALLDFNHICKTDFFDVAKLEISTDGGINFTQIICANYLGTGNFCGQNNQFSAASYGVWLPVDTDAVATNAWWKHETFDISSLVANQSQVVIRWTTYDSNLPNTNAAYPLNGWKIDDICITAAPCELTAPSLTQNGSLQGTIYNLGPFSLSAEISDNSGLANTYIIYTVNGGTPDTITLTNTTGNTYTGQIPAMLEGDTVCYYFYASDASCANNDVLLPASGCIQFIVSAGITFPFCDNFDSNDLWTDSLVTGSAWQLGVPTNGPNAPHSAPNVWDVALNAQYVDGTDSYLTSPHFSFSGITGAEISMWINYNTENCCDEAVLEYSIDGGTTWVVLDNAGNTVNWQSGGWHGNSNGWIQAKCLQPTALDNQADVIFRFHFNSDGSITANGFALDDFCIIPPSPLDAGVTFITQPGLNAAAGQCVDVIVDVKNFGLNPLTSFDIYWTDGTTTFGPTAWTGNLAPGASTTVTLNQCFNVPVGSFNICAYTDLTGDGNSLNDTLCLSGVGVPVLTLTSCDDFESGNLGYVTSSSGTGNDWQLGAPSFGQTNSVHSGTNAWDVNLASAYVDNSDCTLNTPIYDLINPPAVNPALSFWQNRNIDLTEDGLRIEYTVNGGTTWAVLGVVNDPDGVNWYNNPDVSFSGIPGWSGTSASWEKSTYFLTNILAANPGTQFIQFRFIFTSGFPFPILDGVSIDDLCMTQPPNVDAGVIQINTPTGSGQPAGNTSPVEVTIRNFGAQPVTTTNIEWAINGVPQGTPTTFNGNLAPGAISSIIPLNGTLTFPSGQFELCAYTQLVSDGNITNDTTCVSMVGVPVLSPTTCDDFEGGNIGYITSSDGNGSEWELGTPAFGQTNSAHSGTTAWDVNLNSAYAINSTCTLTTAYYDLVNPPAVNTSLSFWQNRNIDGQEDGLRIEYSVDGITWNQLGVVNDPDGVNWFNNADVAFSGTPGWSGNSTGWQKSTYYLTNVLAANPGAQTIQFRFIFLSGFPFPTLDGVSIDDICMTQPSSADAGVIQINTPVTGGQPAGNTSPVEVSIRNFGTQPVTTTNIEWAINGVPQGTPTTFNGNLAPGAISSIIPLNGTLTFPSGQFELCAYTQLVSDGNITNDTTCVTMVGVPILPLSFTNQYCDDFEGPNAGWTVETTGDPGTNWEYGTPAFGSTSSAFSGVNAWDINLNTIYTPNANTILYSPFFDFTNGIDTKLSLYVNFATEGGWDGTRLEYSLNTGPWTTLDQTSPGSTVNWYTGNTNCSNQLAWEDQSGGWIQAQHNDLTFLNGAGNVRFRFIFCSDGSGQVDGFSIDNFCLTVPVPLTVAPVAIGNNASIGGLLFAGQPITYNANIKNTGTTPLSSAVAALYVDNNLIATDTIAYSPLLAQNAVLNHQFSTPWIATAGVHNVCVITSYPNQGTDLNPTDDTICSTISVIDTLGVTVASPYCNDFEGGPQWVTLNSINYGNHTSWELGTPAQTIINAAHSGIKAWTNGLTTNYPGRDTSSLFTPAFNVQANENYRLSFYHQYATEIYIDGGNVEYSTDYGANWQLLGAAGQGNQWYNSFFVTALGGTPPAPGWSGTLTSWQQAVHEICVPQAGSVIFRFRFASDQSVAGEGWAIDDFCFEDIGSTCPLSVDELPVSSTISLGQNHPNPTNGTTSIDYYIPERGNVTMQIVNILGQVMDTPVNDVQMQGTHTVNIDANRIAPGIYYYSLTFEGKETLVKKMVITK